MMGYGLHNVPSSLVRGVSGDGPEDGAGSGVPRSWLVTTGSGGSETARRALRPVLQGACCTCSAGNGGAGNADPSQKSPKWERREASVPIARDAGASQAPGVPRTFGTPGVPRKHPLVSRRSAPPHLSGGADKG